MDEPRGPDYASANTTRAGDVSSLFSLLMDILTRGRYRDGTEAASDAITSNADRVIEQETARLARLKPRIASLFRQDWDTLYRDRLRDHR